MTNTLFDAAVWEQAWQEDEHTPVNKMRKAGINPARSFDTKAQTFDREVFSEAGRKRARRIIGWLEDQGVVLEGAKILDIGAASGGFAVPFAEKGAHVTAVETSPPLVEMLEARRASLSRGSIDIVAEPFEELDLEARGWLQSFDLVFVSMCPVIVDWASVQRVLSCARDYCYMSLSVGGREHSLFDEVWPLVSSSIRTHENLEMSYLMNLLLLHGYAYQSLVTREMKTTELPAVAALEEVLSLLKMYDIPADERVRGIVTDHLERSYPQGPVTISQGGRFGKVLVRLSDQRMYSREERD
ncbi:class I SAM-dependent methyltransferase [Paenibacillus sp. 1P07SE]|uniref:class I SAM-dependent methyltransferase n=1 Tax=Paenibacillus sp. 1P07SE TaxID=3132209 RepID=UPI0039A407C8